MGNVVRTLGLGPGADRELELILARLAALESKVHEPTTSAPEPQVITSVENVSIGVGTTDYSTTPVFGASSLLVDANALTVTQNGMEARLAFTQHAVPDLGAWADVAAGADTVNLADLNAKLKAVRDKLQDLLDALQAAGLV